MHGILYPKNYFNTSTSNEALLQEFDFVKGLGIPYAFYDQESLTFDPNVKLYNIDPTVTSYIYRGWMLSEKEYKKLEQSVQRKGTTLAVPVSEYLKTHSFDGWYPLFKEYTFTSVILEDPTDEAEVEHAIQTIGGNSFYVKDFIKSDRDYSGPFTADALYKAVNAFVNDRDSELQGKVVVRKYEPLDSNTAELRLWYKNGENILFAPHPNFTNKPTNNPEHIIDAINYSNGFSTTLFNVLNANFFITIDIARKTTGEWVIVEVGNGQVSGLPDLTNIVAGNEVTKSFYRSLVKD